MATPAQVNYLNHLSADELNLLGKEALDVLLTVTGVVMRQQKAILNALRYKLQEERTPQASGPVPMSPTSARIATHGATMRLADEENILAELGDEIIVRLKQRLADGAGVRYNAPIPLMASQVKGLEKINTTPESIVKALANVLDKTGLSRGDLPLANEDILRNVANDKQKEALERLNTVLTRLEALPSPTPTQQKTAAETKAEMDKIFRDIDVEHRSIPVRAILDDIGEIKKEIQAGLAATDEEVWGSEEHGAYAKETLQRNERLKTLREDLKKQCALTGLKVPKEPGAARFKRKRFSLFHTAGTIAFSFLGAAFASAVLPAAVLAPISATAAVVVSHKLLGPKRKTRLVGLRKTCLIVGEHIFNGGTFGAISIAKHYLRKSCSKKYREERATIDAIKKISPMMMSRQVIGVALVASFAMCPWTIPLLHKHITAPIVQKGEAVYSLVAEKAGEAFGRTKEIPPPLTQEEISKMTDEEKKAAFLGNLFGGTQYVKGGASGEQLIYFKGTHADNTARLKRDADARKTAAAAERKEKGNKNTPKGLDR